MSALEYFWGGGAINSDKKEKPHPNRASLQEPESGVGKAQIRGAGLRRGGNSHEKGGLGGAMENGIESEGSKTDSITERESPKQEGGLRSLGAVLNRKEPTVRF